MHVLKTHLKVAAAAILALTVPAITHAENVIGMGNMTKGYTYYNLPGTTAADHNDAVTACAAEAYKARSYDAELRDGPSTVYSNNNYSVAGIIGSAIGDAIVDDMISAWGRGVYAAAFENCMVVRGWRVVRLPEAEGKDLWMNPAPDIAARIAPWTGAEQPHGEVVRIWKNDAASAATRYLYFRPAHDKYGLLSLTAGTGTSLARVTLAPPQKPVIIGIDPKWPEKDLTPDQIAAALPEAGVIVIRLKGASNKTGLRLTLARMGADKDVLPSTVDHAPDVLTVTGAIKGKDKDGVFVAFTAPPGRWRIASIAAMPEIGFCMGSPSFPIEAGEVVYAGTFDLSAADLGPDLSLDAAKAWLAGKPAADTIRQAAYTNGSLGPCGYNGLYALEIKGAPFDPDYHWGSAAKAPKPTEATPQ
ncbi:hypothetical protein ABAC460_07175 [Asticcacaulis sp. AC460]|uniref:hypothetical protein n=1 Tax=Asticcacaulis sp. AC460 TaxID=1282360 RepID=UPI0003C3E922|nr:hypothetical protein [Asticcacaulis sp. AC460]ESQ91341.1 hypothetical protein ABAC460_07175 [Asticcacaulis sp. AC460]